MKKLFLLFVIVATASICKAQEYDETLLEGKWDVESIEGEFPFGIEKFSGFLFGEYPKYEDGSFPSSGCIYNVEVVDPDSYEDGDIALLDYFICNNDKLHIIVDDYYALHFIISELTADKMVIYTKNHKGTVTLTRSNPESEVAPLISSKKDNTIYDLNGLKKNSTDNSGIYIVNGEKRMIQNR